MKTLHHRTIRLTGVALATFAIAAFPQSPPSNLTVPPITIDSGTQAYQAANSIVTTAGTNDITIGDSASVLFQVTNTNSTSITLLPGFTANAGSAVTTFNALIGALPTTPTPINGTQPVNTPQTTAFTFQNTGDSQPIAGGDITFLLLDGSGNVLNQCPVEFVVSPMSFSLLDTGTSSDGTCTINSDSSINIGSQVLTVNLDVTFLVAGTYNVNTDAIDAVGLLFPWQAAGTWTVTTGSAPGPTITGISPTSGSIGTSVTISGSNFGSAQGSSTVTFGGGAAASVSSWGSTQITVTVPSGAATGAITVTTSAGSASSQTFTVNGSPTISGISPTSGAVGTTATISGSNFGSSQGSSTVTFGGGAAASVSSWGSTQITVTVPSGAATGVITVTTTAGSASSQTFTVNGSPTISGISPTSGAVGTTVTISGSNFGSSQGSSTVTFSGGAGASVSSWSNTQIVATVPSGAAPGAITVTTSFGTATSQTFTLSTPSPSIVSSAILGKAPAATWQSFALKFSDQAGVQAITGGSLTFTNSALSPAAICPITFSWPAGTVRLTDTGQSMTLPATAAGVISDSTCAIQAAASTLAVDSSGALDLTLSISFSPSSAGTFAVTATLTDTATQTSQNGSWTSTTGPLVSFSSNLSQIYQYENEELTFQIADVLGSSAIPYVLVDISQTSANGSLISDCALTYLPAQYFGESYVPPGQNACTLWGQGGDAFPSGQGLSLIFFTNFSYLGSYSVTASVVDSDGLQAPITEIGTLSVLPLSNNSNFTIQLSPNSNSLTVYFDSGYSGSINVTASCQSPCSASVNQSYLPLTYNEATVPFSITSTVPGIYIVTFTATDGAGRQQSLQSPIVYPAPTPTGSDFTLSLPNPVTLGQVTSGSSSLMMQSVDGFSSPVTLSASVVGSVAGLTATVTPTSLIGNGTASIGIATTSQTPPGIYSIIVTGTQSGVSSPITHSAIQQVVVVNQQPASFSFTGTPQSVFWYGTSTQALAGEVSFNNGWALPVQLSANFVSPGSGFTVAVSPTTVYSTGTFSLIVTTPQSPVVGVYPILLTATSGGSTQTVTINFVVTQGNLAIFSVTTSLSTPYVPAMTTENLTLTGHVANGPGSQIRVGTAPVGATPDRPTPKVSMESTGLYTITTSISPQNGAAGCTITFGSIGAVTVGTQFTAPVSVNQLCPAGLYEVTTVATPQDGGPGEASNIVLRVGVVLKEYIHLGGRVVAIESQ